MGGVDELAHCLLTLSTAGLPLALSKLISEADATGRRTQLRRCFNTAMGAGATPPAGGTVYAPGGGIHSSFPDKKPLRPAVLGVAGSAAMLLFTAPLAQAVHNSLAYWPIKALGVSVVCVSVMCAYRGFAQGRQNMVADELGQSQWQAGGGQGEQEGVDIVGAHEVGDALIAQDVVQGDFVERAADFDKYGGDGHHRLWRSARQAPSWASVPVRCWPCST